MRVLEVNRDPHIGLLYDCWPSASAPEEGQEVDAARAQEMAEMWHESLTGAVDMLVGAFALAGAVPEGVDVAPLAARWSPLLD